MIHYRDNAQLRRAVSEIDAWKSDLAGIERQIRNVARGLDQIDGLDYVAAGYLFDAAYQVIKVSESLTKALNEITSPKEPSCP